MSYGGSFFAIFASVPTGAERITGINMANLCLKTVEMHTGGEPMRIVYSGLAEIKGDTILQKWNYIIENLDYIRKFIILEPRGHRDMYGALVVPPDVPEAALAVIFIHSKYYGTMCGHGVMALGRYAIDYGLVKNPTSPETRVVIQCPCGPVETFVEYNNGKTGRVRFNSVPAFVHDFDVKLEIDGYGTVIVDISYGGSFYAILPASRLGLDLHKSSVSELVTAATRVTDASQKSCTITHPEGSELAFVCGTILTDDNDTDDSKVTHQMVVFGDSKLDRSPCGSGTTARVALQYARGQIKLGEVRSFQGPLGSVFTARAIRQLTFGCYGNAVVVEVSGKANYTGTSTLTLEDDDVIGRGFLLR